MFRKGKLLKFEMRERFALCKFTWVDPPEWLTHLPCFRNSAEKAMAPHSSTLAWKIPWTEEPGGSLESDTTERLHFHFSLSCIGEGNGNPLQCSCLENPRDRGAWWAAVYGVAQSQTRLKRLSSSSSSSKDIYNLSNIYRLYIGP